MTGFPSFEEIAERFPALEALRGLGHSSIPFVQQLSSTECGAACLTMVLGFHGKEVSLAGVRELTVSQRDTTSAQMLIEAGRTLGLRGRAVALEVDELVHLDRASILHWGFSHFVVLDRVSRNSIHVLDPAFGRVRVPIEQVRRLFTGVAIQFEPSISFEPGKSAHARVWTFLRRLQGEGALIRQIIVTSVLMQMFGLAVPLITRLIIDSVIPHSDYHLLTLVAIGTVALLVFQAWTSVLRSYLALYLRTRLAARMALGFLDHLLSLPYQFFQRRSGGDLLTRMGSNANVREILTGALVSAFLDGSLAISYLVLLLYISAPIALLSLGFAVAQVLMFAITRSIQNQLIAAGIETASKSQGYLMETLSGVETLKALGAEHRAVDRWSGLFTQELDVSMRRGRLDGILDALGSTLRVASSAVLLGFAAMEVMAGQLTLGEMMASTAVASGFLGPLNNLVTSATRLLLLKMHLERLQDVFETAPERDRSAKGVGQLSGEIAVQDVRFKYGPISPLVVRGISLNIAPGEFLAVVGKSGSGKSTLVKLLVGLYDPTEGSVSYDGADLRQLDVTSVRKQVGVVTQDSQLFSGTIRDNLLLIDPNLPLEAAIRAARLAHLHDDIIAMPMGYETPLGDRGSSMSGGQRQRLALARALVGQPKILVLDEATSHLDTSTERAVQDSLNSLQCTRIVIAHRLSTIIRADRIVVLQEGQIVEVGSHAQLLSRNGVYSQLIAADGTPSAAR